MVVVIRLQGLPVVAGSADIRHYFTGLQIPMGGVHIIGGELGEVFILFATDEDARRAMGRAGGFIKNSVITLHLSSKAEMQHTVNLKAERGSLYRGKTAPRVGPITDLVSEIKKGIHLSSYASDPELGINKEGTRRTHLDASKAHYDRELEDVKYVHLCGMPYLVTEDEVRAFFHDLQVDDVFLLKHPDGRRNGNGIVKFASSKDASEGLKRNKQYIGARYIEVSQSSEEKWARAGGFSKSQKDSRGRSRERSPAHEMYAKHHSGTDSPPKKQRIYSNSPPRDEFYVHMKNLPKHTGKQPVMNFFKDLDLVDTQIKIIPTKHNTMDAFVVLKNEVDYNKALGFHKEMLDDQRIYIYNISRKSMLEMIDDFEAFERKRTLARERTKENLTENNLNPHSGSKIVLYVRNLPFDVTAIEVQKFFVGLDVHENDVQLLTDGKGVGLGEALVRFSSDEHAKNAESLNRHKFLGAEVLLQRISEKQGEELGLKPIPDVKDRDSRHSPFGQKDPSSVEPSGSDSDFRIGSGEFKTKPEEFRGPPPQKGVEGENSFGRERMEGLPPDARFSLDGRVLDGRFSDRFPDGRLPDGRLPDGRLPDGRLPDGRFPDGRLPDGRFPDGRFPDGRFLDSRIQDGRRPDSWFPSGRLPDGRFLDGKLPEGRFPEGRLLGSFLPNEVIGKFAGGITKIRMNNLPYTVRIDEIYDFFHGFQVVPGSVNMSYTLEGLPTGVATVALENYENAVAAVSELNERPVGPRKVTLSLCTDQEMMRP